VRIVGLVGGIGPESTIDYYRLLLARFRERGSPRNPDILINSIDVARLLSLADSGDRAGLTEYLAGAVQVLARAGADLALFAANTPHLVFDEVQRRAPIELVSIVAATCEAARRMGLTRVGLLGTRVTMRGDFYRTVFAERGITVVAPEATDLEDVHQRYVKELVAGTFLAETRTKFFEVIDRMRARDAIQGVILRGTELPLLLRGAVHPLPFLDTTRIHVDAVVERAISDTAADTRTRS